MSLRGKINNNLEPIIPVRFKFRDGKVSRIYSGVIDTGFNGFLSVPSKIIRDAQWDILGFENYELASGELLEVKVYLGTVQLGLWQEEGFILESKSPDILIGTQVFRSKVLMLDFKKKSVVIHR